MSVPQALQNPVRSEWRSHSDSAPLDTLGSVETARRGHRNTKHGSHGCSFCVSSFSLGGMETVKGKSDCNLDIQEFGVSSS